MSKDKDSVEVLIINPEPRLSPALEMQEKRYPKETLTTSEKLEGLLEDIMYFCDDNNISFHFVMDIAREMYLDKKSKRAPKAKG